MDAKKTVQSYRSRSKKKPKGTKWNGMRVGGKPRLKMREMGHTKPKSGTRWPEYMKKSKNYYKYRNA